MCVCVSERYRIQSDSFEDMWLLVTELLRRFDQHFSTLGVKDFRKSFSGPLPLQDYFLSVDQHFQVSAASAGAVARTAFQPRLTASACLLAARQR